MLDSFVPLKEYFGDYLSTVDICFMWSLKCVFKLVKQNVYISSFSFCDIYDT